MNRQNMITQNTLNLSPQNNYQEQIVDFGRMCTEIIFPK